MESRSIWTSAPGAGPVPAAQARASSSRATASRDRTSPKLNERRQVPSVEGARAGNTSPAAPARITSTSSMLSAPASIPPIIVIALTPTFAAPRRTRQIDAFVDQLGDPEPLGELGRGDQPGVRHQVRLIEGDGNPAQIVRMLASVKCPLDRVDVRLAQDMSSLTGGHSIFQPRRPRTRLTGGSWVRLMVGRKRLGQLARGPPRRRVRDEGCGSSRATGWPQLDVALGSGVKRSLKARRRRIPEQGQTVAVLHRGRRSRPSRRASCLSKALGAVQLAHAVHHAAHSRVSRRRSPRLRSS